MQTSSVRPKTETKELKLLEENLGVSLHGLNLGNGFLDITPKGKQPPEN